MSQAQEIRDIKDELVAQRTQMDVTADRWTYTVPVPLHSILEVLELIMPEQMSALADHNIQMMNIGAFANVRLPSYASVIDALMQ